MIPSLPISPECRLVFRSADPACAASEITTLARAVGDWLRVLRLAEQQVATANMWRLLQQSGAPVPADAVEYLRKSAMVSDFRMQHLSGRLRDTVRVLVERGVPFLLLKGAAVGAMMDPTFRARPMTDIDLLVRREDAARAREAIIESGWPETKDPVLLELLEDAHHLPPFIDPQMPGVRLELHVALLPDDHSFAFGEEDLWREARPAPEPFGGALLPSPTHLLVHASVHFAWQHGMWFGAWRTFRIVGAVLAEPTFQWNEFVAAARAAKAVTACYWTLRLAERLSGIAVPTEVLAGLEAPSPEWLRAALERHFIAGIAFGEGAPSPSVRVSRLLWGAALRPAWSGHRSLGRSDPEHRWERARGTLSTETFPARVARHFAEYRSWWQYLTRTLIR